MKSFWSNIFDSSRPCGLLEGSLLSFLKRYFWPFRKIPSGLLEEDFLFFWRRTYGRGPSEEYFQSPKRFFWFSGLNEKGLLKETLHETFWSSRKGIFGPLKEDLLVISKRASWAPKRNLPVSGKKFFWSSRKDRLAS